MGRAPAMQQAVVLPQPQEQYDANNERETRRLLEEALRRALQWGTVSEVPPPVAALSAVTGAADTLPYFTGVSTMALTALTPYARTIIACATAAAARTVLGLGVIATLNTVQEGNITLADVLTGNVSSTAHGFAPKAPADATKFLNGAATPAFVQVKGSDLAMSDVTTNDVTTTRHGFVPKAPNDATKFLRGDGTWAVATAATAPVYPFDSTTGLMLRYNASLSNKDLTSLGYVKKWYDISGNGRDTAVNTTNPPKWTDMGYLGKFPALFFDFNMKLMAASMPGLGSPLACTIIVVLMNAESSGNSHIYNYSGNPIGFGSVTPLDYMYNGTLPAAHPMSQESQTHVATSLMTKYPAVAIHSYNGASSVQCINGNEVTVSPGTSATGTTNLFTIGSDSSTGVAGATSQTCRMMLAEIAVLNFAANSTQRAALNTYYKTLYGVSF